ncbi:glycoside hydrolase family 78 protein [Enterobacter sp. ENT03]|uniref:glycoside hydrolase family 78 protein n=1 Tax=Enterobacter sp. ENT03 TaxID=2854780 RepID=UPI001C469430|nr:glycoside hydrolase family 78 protein [Enterobacter sp. ENT03]MBV7404054.1 glycoside hydrolase family 78 protein [Enterobacter sp. ENT03]
MLAITKITLNYEQTLTGVDEFPLLGWHIISDRRNVTQQNWHLQCSTDTAFTAMLFDSGWVNGSASMNVALPDIPLAPSTRYFLRVRIKDNHGEQSDWRLATFVTGMRDTRWQAEFISAETPEDKHRSNATLLRNTFSLTDKSIASAFVHVTALGLYNLYLNGERVGDHELTPGWTSYSQHLLYQTYDVTAMLQRGVNAIGAELGAGWFKGDMGFMRHRNFYGAQTALLCQVVIYYQDGTRQVVASDASWRADESPILFSELYDGEIYDARQERAGWQYADFEDGAWRAVSVIGFNKQALTAQGAGHVKRQETLRPKAIFTTPAGDTVIDFGQNLSGWVEFTVSGQPGDNVVLRHFETLDAQGNVYLDNLRSAKQRVEYTLKGGDRETFHPHFTFQGFRYVKVEHYPGQVNADDFQAIVLHSDMQQTGRFSCSNPDLNQLHHNILWGLKGNFVDVPTDCPQRDERLGWTGDAQIFCRTASYLMQTRNFFAKWLTDLMIDQTPEGGVPHVIPDILTGHCEADRFLAEGGTHSSSAWADAAVINPWTIYLMYGDTRILENQYESMKAWIDFMHAHADNHLWRYKLQFGDWVALDAQEGSYFGATPDVLTCTAYYAYSSGLFARAAAVLGRDDDAANYRALHQAVVARFQAEFFTPDGMMTARTQTAHILALYFDLVPEAFRARTINTLVELLDEHDGHLVTGFVGTPYFCHALSQNGRVKEAWALLLKDDFPSWLYQVKAGATTIWEHWDGIKPDGSMWSPDMNSFNHYAYGAVGEWLYRAVAGIEADEMQPGFKHVIISPLPGGDVTFVEAGYQSVYGEIAVHWRRVGEGIRLSVRIPANTTATLKLPASQITDAGGLVFTQGSANWCATTGSGEYHVEFLLAEYE